MAVARGYIGIIIRLSDLFLAWGFLLQQDYSTGYVLSSSQGRCVILSLKVKATCLLCRIVLYTEVSEREMTLCDVVAS